MPDPSLNPARQAPHDPLPTIDYLPTPAETIDLTTDGQRSQSTRGPGTPGNEPAARPDHSGQASPELPVISGYVVTGEIARGGMGRVYAGHDLVLDREVAIKTLLPSANAERFIVEAKITAKLPHPAIPPVYALGALADGAPYLAMKLIRGRTLAELLRERTQLELPQFLQIFEQIAQAVGFAHTRGITHRDLKPANVMVGAFGEVQVMDWGLAKEMQSGDSEVGRAHAKNPRPDSAIRNHSSAFDFTDTGSVFGTPGYMSPEQARGEAVDARTDVFALGSILAAILTGQPAFVGKTVPEIMRQAVTNDLSDVLARLAECRADAELIALAQRFLAADARQRPENAHVVASEIAAYRAGVEQRLRNAETQAAEALVREAEGRKRRHVWWALTAVSLIGVVVASGLAWWANESRKDANLARAQEAQRADSENKARIEEQRAKEQTERRLEQIKKGNAIVNSIFRDFNIREVKSGTEPLEAVLAKRLIKAGEELQGEAIGDPLIVAELQHSLARSLISLGQFQAAIDLLTKSRATFLEHLGPDHENTLEAAQGLAAAYEDAGQFNLAIPLFEEVLRRYEVAFGSDHPQTLVCVGSLASAYRENGQLDLAQPLLDRLSKSQRGGDRQAVVSLLNQATGLMAAGKPKQALPLLSEALQISRQKNGPDHYDTLGCMINLADCHQYLKNYDEARPLYEEALKKMQATLGANHPSTLTCLNNFGNLYLIEKKFDLAIGLFEQLLTINKTKLGPDHPNTLKTMSNLATCYMDAGKTNLALAMYEETLSLTKGKLGPDHPFTLVLLEGLADAYKDADKLESALPVYEELLQQFKAKHGPNHAETIRVMRYAGMLSARVGKGSQAAAYLTEAMSALRQQPAKPSDLGVALGISAASLLGGGEYAAAEEMLREALEIWEQEQPNSTRTLATQSLLGDALLGQKKYEEAELIMQLCFQALVEREVAKPGSADNQLTSCIDSLIKLYAAQDKPDEVKKWQAERKKYSMQERPQ